MIAKTVSEDETDPEPEDGDMERILPNLPDYPDQYWPGHTLKVFTFDYGKEFEIFNARDITAEEETGDPINDAVYRRNAVLAKRYNFILKPVFDTAMYDDEKRTAVRRAVLAGDNYFDVFMTPLFLAGGMAEEGLLVDLFDVRYLDFEKPWWDRGAVTNLSIGHKLFFAIGDSVLINKNATSAILFNKQLITDLQLENPYEFVRGGQWTLGKLGEMAKAAMADLDGNGRMDSESDRFGYLPGAFEPHAWLALGVRFAEKDEDDLPFLTFASEQTFTAIQAYTDFWRAQYRWFPPGGRSGTLSDGDGTFERVFDENRSLFLLGYLRAVERLRGMETDFGILPMPKLDEYQREYGHWITGVGQAMAIPQFHDDVTLDRIGFMLEAIAAESRYTVIPAYYDVQLTRKFARDEESKEMLDIIFGSIVWDPCLVYDWFDWYSFDTNVTTYRTAAGYERYLGRVEAKMQKTVDSFADIR